MKNQLAILLLLFVCLCSCKKEKSVKGLYDYYDGKIIAETKGWKPKLIALSNHNDSFWLIMTDQKDGFIRHQIHIGVMPLRLTNYFLEDGKIWDTSRSSSIKAMIPVYHYGQSDIYIPMYLRKDYPRFINISSYDSVQGIIEGTFSLTLMSDTARSASDTLSISEGSFSAKIHNPDELPK